MPTTTIQQFNLFLNGQTRPASKEEYFDAVNPSTGEVFAHVACAAQEDMRAAIRSARKAFDDGFWPSMSLPERGIYLKRIAELIRKYAKELAELETLDCGKTLKQTSFIDIPTAAECFEYFSNIDAGLFERSNKIEAPVKSTTLWEPLGVVGCIIPWNYPLIIAAWKLAPALIAGNAVILKPSPLACTSVLRLGEILEEADLPAGVVNILSTRSNDAAAELVKSGKVDMISFTGRTATGREIQRAAAETTKKVSLELSGKSANIVFADCDLEAAAGGTLSSIFMNQGAMCTACSRLLLEEKIYDQFLSRLVEKTKNLKIGPANDYQADFGPLISKEHRDKVLSAIEAAAKEGARLVCGGRIPLIPSLTIPTGGGGKGGGGFYLEPTILADVNNSMAIARDEIFGPVLSVIKFSGQEEAVKIANDSKYGLAACIWSKDLKKADAAAKKLRCGTVWINTYGGFYNEASFGGYKQSGYGRTLGVEGLLEFMRSKHVCTDQTPGGRPLAASWF